MKNAPGKRLLGFFPGAFCFEILDTLKELCPPAADRADEIGGKLFALIDIAANAAFP